MWWRSASFLDQRHQEDPPNDIASSFKEPDTLSTLSPPQTYSSFTAAAADPFNPIPNPKISAYYQTRAAHTAVVTSDWLAQGQAVVGHHPYDSPAPQTQLLASPSASGKASASLTSSITGGNSPISRRP
nr:hypothetical protein CFP56_27828 [Quercus suber]